MLQTSSGRTKKMKMNMKKKMEAGRLGLRPVLSLGSRLVIGAAVIMDQTPPPHVHSDQFRVIPTDWE